MRGALSFEAVSKSYGSNAAVRDVSLEVHPGEFLTLLGPSGCGKTTLLRMAAGFESPDSGRVLISGRDVTGVPPHQRPVNMVFQHYALFPHRTVAGNVAFGLESAGRPRSEIDTRVARVLETVRMADLGNRRIDQLSGGQKQRVALARALVLEPEVLLLDEPMSALDRKLREEMRVEVKHLHERLGTTFLFVTHYLEAALTTSDRVAVMNVGRIEQVGAPEELYERPRTRFAAEFLAVRNLWPATVGAVGAGRAAVTTDGGFAFAARDDGAFRRGERVWVGVRPERMAIDGGGENRLAGILEDEVYLGDRTHWRVRVAGALFIVAEGVLAPQRRRGEAVTVTFAPEAVLRLDAPSLLAGPP
jgi:ABC-type Fe3+/spermidine/putrescine transport system ATPase subunit